MGERAGELRRPAGGAAAAPTIPETGASPETAALRGDIEQTRAEMTGTIDAIQEKLDPEVLQEQAKDTIREAKAAAVEVVDHAITQAKQAVRGATVGKVEDMARYAEDTAGGWRDTLVETVKAHPIPAALAGLSLGYLLLNREPARARTARPGGALAYRPQDAWNGSDDAVAYRRLRAAGPGPDGDGEPSVADRAGAMAGQLQETAGQAVGRVQETAGQAADQVQETAQRAQGFLSRQLEENPLAVGAVAVVLGGALGAAVGTTPREDRLFGAARDRLMGRAQEMTKETLGQVEERVGRVVSEVQDTAGRAADELKSTAEREARAQDLLPEGPGAGSSSPQPQPRPGGDGAPRQR